MEKIFKESRVTVGDNGFSQGVIGRIYDVYPQPSRSIYRGPTLIATFVTILVILVLTLTVGLGEMNCSYDKFASVLSYNNTHIDSGLDMNEFENE